jgi:hypothetical protein
MVDNPSVSQALEADNVRKKQEDRAFFKNLSEKLEKIEAVNSKLNSNIDKQQQNQDIIKEKFDKASFIENFMKLYKGKKSNLDQNFSPVEMSEVNKGKIIDVGGDDDISQEGTQLKVLNGINAFQTLIPEIYKPLQYVSTKINNIYSEITRSNKLLETQIDKEDSIKFMMGEALEQISSILLRDSSMDNNNGGEEFESKSTLYEWLKDKIINTISKTQDIIIKGYEKHTPKMVKSTLSITAKSNKMMMNSLGGFMNFIGFFLKVISPFNKLFLGLGALSLIGSMFNYMGDFTSTAEKITSAFSEGFAGTSDAVDKLIKAESGTFLENLKGVISSFASDFLSFFGIGGENKSILSSTLSSVQSDILGMFEFSDKFKTLITNVKNLFENNIVPLMEAIKVDLFGRIFTLIKPFIEKFNNWWNSSGPQDLGIAFDKINNVLIDSLNFLFTKILPPIFDTITSGVKAVMPVVEAIGSIVKEFIDIMIVVIPDIFQGVIRQFDNIVLFFQDITKNLVKIFAPESFSEFFSGLEGLIGSVIKFALNTLDNIATTIFDIFNIDEWLGMKDGEKISEAIMRFFSFIGDSIEQTFADARMWILNSVDEMIGKVTGFFTSIFDMIPSVADITAMIKNSIKSIDIPGSSWLIDKMFGKESQLTPTAMDSNIFSTNETRKSDIDRLKNYNNQNSATNIVMAPTNNNVNAGNQRNTTRRLVGNARTTASSTPSDKVLYGG